MSSTYCFCCFTLRDPLPAAIETHHACYFGTIWKKESLCPNGRFSWINLGKASLCYIPQMLTFLISTIHKILLLIGNFLALLISLPFGPERRFLIFLDNLAAIFIDIVGIACPPAAYKLHSLAADSLLHSNCVSKWQRGDGDPKAEESIHSEKESDDLPPEGV